MTLTISHRPGAESLAADIDLRISGRVLHAALATIPPEYREHFVLRLLGLEPSGDPVPEARAPRARSYPLTVEQARALKLKVDPGTWAIVRVALQNTQGGVAAVSWGEIQELTDRSTWAQFAKGRLGGLNRALRNVVGDPRAVLLWEADDWVGDGEGGFKSGTLVIDGSAVEALKRADAKLKFKVKPRPAAGGAP